MDLFGHYKIGESWKKPSMDFVGESHGARHVLNRVKVVAPTNMTVVLQGESGTGKELIARMIHEGSSRRGKPFIAVDCGAIPETLVESELFGYEKGAFTGAGERKEGKFESANTGTLFLDEITNLPHTVQAKLLRVIQERKVQRLGSIREISVDVRIIVATNTVLAEEVKRNKFRNDLYHRINEFDIHLPPLRERKEDIPLLAKYFLEEATIEFNKVVEKIEAGAMKNLLDYHWPGNIRELRNIIRRAILMADSNTVQSIALPGPEPKGYRFDPLECLEKGMSLIEITRKASEMVEMELIKKVMAQANNNKTMAAKLLNINRMTLYSKMKSLGL